ncbi:MAG TPA: hypothetical protein VFH63_05900 [candidate division Zixibacteria bacterium]|nr:hypothetical protein [candidate division Zixibacteria bacterium]
MTRPAHLAGFLQNATDMPVRAILLFLLIAQLGDAATFMLGMNLHGIHLESNGVAVAAYQAGGVEAVLLLKGAAILAVLGVLVATAHRFPRLLVWGGAAATAMGLLGIAANVTSLMIIG